MVLLLRKKRYVLWGVYNSLFMSTERLPCFSKMLGIKRLNLCVMCFLSLGHANFPFLERCMDSRREGEKGMLIFFKYPQETDSDL